MLRNLIATDRAHFHPKNADIGDLSYLSTKTCGYSLEARRRGASNEYSQHTFSWRNKKNIMWIPTLICSYESIFALNCSVLCSSQ